MLRALVSKSLSPFGLQVVSRQKTLANGLTRAHRDIEDDFLPYREKVKAFTMTSLERQYGLYKALQYVVSQKIEGDFVECGVFRGGSSMLAALYFKDVNEAHRDLWLYDTYAGMTPPTEFDAKSDGDNDTTITHFDKLQQDGHNDWCYASLEDVQNVMKQSQYPADKIHYIKGNVMKTIPAQVPSKIALLRLDTDFYDSTKHELEHLYDLVVPGGVILIDDYGSWQGAKKAVDEYWATLKPAPLLSRIDDTGRIAVKP